MRSNHTGLVVALSMFVACLSTAAHADTDGSYCIGQGYAAIEARGLWLKAEQPTVYLVFVGSSGISDRIAVDIQTDGNRYLHCGPMEVITSDGSVIDLLTPRQPRVLRVEPKPGTEFSDDLLPYIRESKALPIASADEDHHYSLVLSHVEQVSPSGGMVLHHVSARVVQSDKFGKLIDARLLAEGIRLETVD